MEERTSEIYKIMKNKKEEEERQAEEADKKQDIVWREQGKYILYTKWYKKEFFKAFVSNIGANSVNLRFKFKRLRSS